MLTLYENPLSPYAQKVKLALYEKGLDFEVRGVNLLGAPDDAFLRTNPRREVPSLVDGDVTLFDSTIILEYLEERWPSPRLLPESPAERARARMLEELCDTHVEAIVWGVTEVKFFGRGGGERGDVGRQLLDRARAQLAGVWQHLDRHLADRPHFDGEAFGRGDLSVFPHVSSAWMYGLGPSPDTKLGAWLRRVAGRPSAQKVGDAAKAVLGALPDLPALVAQSHIVRQYRDHRLEWMMRSGGEEVVRDGLARKNIRFSAEID